MIVALPSMALLRLLRRRQSTKMQVRCFCLHVLLWRRTMGKLLSTAASTWQIARGGRLIFGMLFKCFKSMRVCVLDRQSSSLVLLCVIYLQHFVPSAFPKKLSFRAARHKTRIYSAGVCYFPALEWLVRSQIPAIYLLNQGWQKASTMVPKGVKTAPLTPTIQHPTKWTHQWQIGGEMSADLGVMAHHMCILCHVWLGYALIQASRVVSFSRDFANRWIMGLIVLKME